MPIDLVTAPITLSSNRYRTTRSYRHWDRMTEGDKASRALLRRVQRALASPTEVEAARKTLAFKAMRFAADNRGVTIRDVVVHLQLLVEQTADLKLAAETLKADLFQVELRKLARQGIAEAPGARARLGQAIQAARRTRLAIEADPSDDPEF
jgi:hypothetical protein